MQIRRLESMAANDVYTLYLAAVGAPAIKLPVRFADDASRAFLAYRDYFSFGSSAMAWGCGEIRNSTGELVARISYNGRIWDRRGYQISESCLPTHLGGGDINTVLASQE